jgi:pimeloyl-ACP methyl ester carboxylesterase
MCHARVVRVAHYTRGMPHTGQMVRLSEGLTHWQREGAADGIPIVLVHGATVPGWEFDCLVPPLLRAGFQTLRFDLYGHGASDRPRGPYAFERFARQLDELLDATDFPRPLVLLGHSFGGTLVAAAAAARPQIVSKLVLVAPMLDFNSTSAWTKLFRAPAIGELAMRYFGVPALVRRRRRRYAAIGQPHFTPRFIEQVEYAGFGRALVSMFRTAALGNQSARYEALRGFEGDVLVVTGDHDVIIPAHHIEKVRSLLPAHEHCAVPGEHNLLLTHPQLVVDALVKFAAPAASGN